MGAEEIVTVSITNVLSPISQVGFGTPLIMDADNSNGLAGATTGRFADTAGMITAGFLATDPAYLMAQAVFAQTPHPPQVVIGKRALKPTLQWKVTPIAVNLKKYSGLINNLPWTFTSDGTATLAEIIVGIKAAIDALAIAVTTVNNGPNVSLGITMNVVGAWFQFSVDDPTVLSVEQVHADPGIATDMAAVILSDSDWYTVLMTTQGTAEVTALAAWIQANPPKTYLVGSQDTRIITNSALDIASVLKAAAYTRTAVFYHPSNGQVIEAAVAGFWLPLVPGSETLHLKTVTGVSFTSLTPAQKTFALGKFCNTYTKIANRNVIQEGFVALGSFLDQIRGRDWFTARLQERIFTLLANSAYKISFTTEGALQVQNQVMAQLREGITNQYIAPFPEPTSTVPNVSSLTTADKAARRLPSVTFTYTEAGAIHKVVVSGVVSV